MRVVQGRLNCFFFLPDSYFSEKLVAQLVSTIYSTKFFQVENADKIDINSQPIMDILGLTVRAK